LSKSTGRSSHRNHSASFRDRERTSTRFPNIIVTLFLGIAILLLGVAAALTVTTGRRLAREVRVPGYVVDLVVRYDQARNAFYYPVVVFTLPDGTRQTLQLAEGSWPPAYAVDQAVTLAYDPQHPLQVRIRSDGDALLPWLAPLITGAVGLAFLAAALGVRRFLLPPPAKDRAS
jgi:hypothetical protein